MEGITPAAERTSTDNLPLTTSLADNDMEDITPTVTFTAQTDIMDDATPAAESTTMEDIESATERLTYLTLNNHGSMSNLTHAIVESMTNSGNEQALTR